MQESSPSDPHQEFSIDLRTERDAIIYTSGFAFHQHMVSCITPKSIVRICTYNVGINVGVEYLDALIKSLCKGLSVHMLVGHNPHHMENVAIQNQLKRWSASRNLHIHLQEKQHGKFIIVETGTALTGYAGSLNFINPTLADVMVRLTIPQCLALRKHFDYQWTLGRPLSHVHPVNKTLTLTPCPKNPTT